MKRIYSDYATTTLTDPEVGKAGKKTAKLKKNSKYSFKIKIICFAAYAFLKSTTLSLVGGLEEGETLISNNAYC